MTNSNTQTNNEHKLPDEGTTIEEIRTDKESMKILRNKSKQGDPDAMFRLSLACLAKDRDKARRLVLRAAKKGHPYAQCCIGYSYLSSKDYINGVKWLAKAAEQGVEEARDKLEALCSDDDD